MRRILGVLLVGAWLLVPASSQTSEDSPADGSVLRLLVVTDAGDVHGTCVLIHREDRGVDAVLYFVTSSHLFRAPGDERLRVQAVRVPLDGERALDVRRDDIFIPPGAVIDVAVLRTTTALTTLAPRPLNYEPPSPSEAFVIAGYDRNGAAAAVAEQVRFQSTLFVVGNRDASTLTGCVGAPAISRDGVFGVVSECNAGRAPVIALLSVARSFIDRHVPRPTTHTFPAPQHDRVNR